MQTKGQWAKTKQCTELASTQSPCLSLRTLRPSGRAGIIAADSMNAETATGGADGQRVLMTDRTCGGRTNHRRVRIDRHVRHTRGKSRDRRERRGAIRSRTIRRQTGGLTIGHIPQTEKGLRQSRRCLLEGVGGGEFARDDRHNRMEEERKEGDVRIRLVLRLDKDEIAKRVRRGGESVRRQIRDHVRVCAALNQKQRLTTREKGEERTKGNESDVRGDGPGRTSDLWAAMQDGESCRQHERPVMIRARVDEDVRRCSGR